MRWWNRIFKRKSIAKCIHCNRTYNNPTSHHCPVPSIAPDERQRILDDWTQTSYIMIRESFSNDIKTLQSQGYKDFTIKYWLNLPTVAEFYDTDLEQLQSQLTNLKGKVKISYNTDPNTAMRVKIINIKNKITFYATSLVVNINVNNLNNL